MLEERPVETTLYSLGGPAPGPMQRRTSERHLSLLRVGSLQIGDRRELCLIRNVSAGGMMIRAYSPLAEGTRVAIELKQGEPVEGAVRWTKDECVGVEFDRPIDVVELISASGDGPRPRMPRVEVQCTAWVREDATVHRAAVSNISQGGIRIVGAAEIPVGVDVTVTLIGLTPIRGTTRWKDDDAVGIGFNRPLGLPTLVAWLQQMQQQERRRAAG